jgi:hypothetical protein
MTRTEAILRLELLKKNPDLISKFEDDRRKEQEAYFRTMVGVGGSVRRTSAGAVVLTTGRMVDMSEPAGDRLIKREALPKAVQPSVPTGARETDYSKLLVAESRRRASWYPSAKWKENHATLLRWVQVKRRDQVALVAAEMASEELRITTPEVRAWRGDETKATGMLGWVYANKPDEINVTLDRECRSVVKTTAHECRHHWQFANFPEITREQGETDAQYYAKNFAERVFENRAN